MQSETKKIMDNYDTSCLVFPSMELKSHQIEFVSKFFKSPLHGMIAVHPTGSGKTALALSVARCYMMSNPANSVVLCTSKTLLNNYKNEMDKMGFPEERSKYRIFSFDTFYRGYSKYNNSIKIEDLEDDIESDSSDIDSETAFSTKSSLFIVDEAHNLKTERGKKATIFIKAAHEADKVLLTTATPLVNYISDAANLISMVSKLPMMRKKQFEEIMMDRNKAKNIVGGYFDFYDLRDEDKKEYPEVSYENIYIKMPESLYLHYKAQESYLEGKSEEEITNDFFNENLSAFYTGVRLAANINPAELDGSMVKSTWIKDFVRSNHTKRILIFSQYVKYGCELVRSSISDLGITTGVIYGKCTPSQRDETVKRYNQGNINILIISNCGKEGLDLKNTDIVIIYENGWNKVTEDQVVGRAVRRGSHNNFRISQNNKSRGKVKVFRLLMVKPEEFDNDPAKSLSMKGKININGNLKSIDILLMSLANEKSRILKDSFETIKIFNSEVTNERNDIYKESISISTQLNRLILGILDRRLFVSSKIESEGIGKRVLTLRKDIYLEIALLRLSCLPVSTIIDTDFFKGRYNADTKFFELYLILKFNSTEESVDIDNLLDFLSQNVTSSPIHSSNISLLVSGLRRVGPLVKDKIYYSKIITRLNILLSGNKIFICMLLDMFNCVVFRDWNPIKDTHIRLRSSFDDLSTQTKKIYIWNGKNINTIIGEQTEMLPGGIKMGNLRDSQIISSY